MNTLKNNVSLIGNLGQDPEITEFGKDKMVAHFSIATNESYKDKKGEWVEKTTWHNIVAWEKMAELCQKQLQKGSKMVLQGQLVNETYTTKDGETRHTTKIKLREFMPISLESKAKETTKA